MTVKIVKVRSLTTLPCAYSSTVDLMAVDLFSRMHEAGALDGLGEDSILADHFYAAGRAVIHAVRDAVNDGRLPF